MPETLLSIGCAASAAEVMSPPLQPGQPIAGGADGGAKVTGATTEGRNVAAGLSAPTTPLAISRTGWSRVSWMIASAVWGVPAEFLVMLRAWFVSSKPSANGSVETVTEKRMSAVLAAGG